MKKIYATIALAAVALGASAQQLQQFVRNTPKSLDARIYAEQPAQLPALSDSRAKVPSIQPVIAVEDIVGYYKLTFTDLLTEGYPTTESSFEIYEDSGTDVTITGLFNEDVKATVDLYSSTLTINFPQDLWTSSQYGTVQALHYYFDSNYELVNTTESVVATFDKATGTLSFEAYDIIGEGVVGTGYFSLMIELEAQKTTNPLIAAEGWDDVVGTATFVDGWCMCVFADNENNLYDPADYPYEVKVQVNRENPGLVRLVNPYENSYIAAANYADDFNGYIVLDISDPDFVIVVPRIYSGMDLGDAEDGNMAMYPCNLAGYYVYIQGYTAEEMKQYYALGYVTYGKNKDAAVPSTYKNSVVTVNEPGFGITGAVNSFYTWTSSSVKMKPVITLPDLTNVGVTDVAVDADAAPEYFNLQGIRVENPESGQIYIRRQGNTTSKVVVVR